MTGRVTKKDRETLKKGREKLSLCGIAPNERLSRTADRKNREKGKLKAALKEL